MADIKPWLETALTIAGPGYLIFRRVFYGISLAAGSFMAAQQERQVSEKEAYELGRAHVIKTLADFAALKWAAIDWKAVFEGLAKACNEIELHARVAARGFVRDFRLVRDFVLRKRAEKPHETVALLHEAIVKKEPVVEARALIGIQNEIGVLVNRGEGRDLDETHRLVQLRRDLKTYETGVVEEADGTGAPLHALFTPPQASLWSLALPRVCIALLVAAGGFFGLWRFSEAEKQPLRLKLASAQEDAKTYRLAFGDAKARLDTAYLSVTTMKAKCVNELQNTANEADRLQKRITAMKKKRAEDEKALVQSGAAVSVGSVLNDLWEGQPSKPAPDAAPDGASSVPNGPGSETPPVTP